MFSVLVNWLFYTCIHCQCMKVHGQLVCTIQLLCLLCTLAFQLTFIVTV